MKAKMKIVIQHCGRTTEEIYAAPIILAVSGYSKPIMAAADKRGNRWFVTDLNTGAHIATEVTRKDAIYLAIERLKKAGEVAYDARCEALGTAKSGGEE